MVANYVNVPEADYRELPLEPVISLDTRVIYTPPRKCKARIAFVRDYDAATGWYFVEYWIVGGKGRAIASGGWVPLESIRSLKG